MARAMWKGVLQVGSAEVPVKLYAAVQDRAVRFRMLQRRNRAPVSQRMVDPEAEKPVETEAIVKGYETEPGVFVVLDEDFAYFALAKALGKQDRVGIASWVMRKKEYAGALLAHGDYLMLLTLRHAGEVIPASALPRPGGRKPEEREIAMARQLVQALEAEFDLAAFHDEYRERVEELVQAKAEGRTLKVKKFERKASTKDSLGDLLKASVDQAKERRVA